MKQYTPDNMSRRDLRKCYSQFSISILLLLASTYGMALLLSLLSHRFFAAYLSDPFWYPIIQISINDLSSYLPGLILLPLLLRKLPAAPPLPVDRLSLWELLQALVFSFGAGYLFLFPTNLLIDLLEKLLGITAFDAVSTLESSLPPGLLVLAFVVIAPVFEEILFRGILLRRLRGLGDVSAVVLSALAFGLFHANLQQTAYAIVLGMVFAAIVLLTGSIRDTILLHMAINGASVLLLLLDSDLSNLLFLIFVFLCMGGCIAFFVTTWKNYHMEPGPLPFHARDKRRACLLSPWFWLLLIIGLGLSVSLVFF